MLFVRSSPLGVAILVVGAGSSTSACSGTVEPSHGALQRDRPDAAGGGTDSAGVGGSSGTGGPGGDVGTSGNGGSQGVGGSEGGAGPVFQGCSIFPGDNPWNTDVSD